MTQRQKRTIALLDSSLRIEIAGLDAEIHQMHNGSVMPDWFKLNTNKFHAELDGNLKTLANQNKVNHDSLHIMEGNIRQRQQDMINQVQSLYQVVALQIPQMIQTYLTKNTVSSSTPANASLTDVEAQSVPADREIQKALNSLITSNGNLKQRQRDILNQVQSLYQVIAVQIPRMIKVHLSSQRPTAPTPVPTLPNSNKPDCFDVEAQTGPNPASDHETQTVFTPCCDVEAQTDYTVLQLGED
eukprot:sb/3468993/